jgi:hypothetical protein
MRKTIIFMILLLVSRSLFCQQDKKQEVTKDSTIKTIQKNETIDQAKVRRDNRPWQERIAIGFGSSFWIKPSQTYIEISPVLAYRFPKTLISGVGYRYIYRHERLVGRDLNAYGPNIFARASLLKRFYFWTEYEILTNEYLTQVAGQELTRNKTYTDSWFAGLGYVRSIGRKGRGGISIQVLYNFLYKRDDINPYYSPVTYRVGYYF